MIDKIILNIHHSDDYTDYLFLTAGLTNKRIIPLLNTGPADLMNRLDNTTLVVNCYASRREPGKNALAASYNQRTRSFTVQPGYYLAEDGTINTNQAAMARTIIQERLNGILFSGDNLHEVYRRYFPLFWNKRELIYANPNLFYAKSGLYDYPLRSYIPLGVMLKAIEDNPELFKSRKGKGCGCKKQPLIIDYDDNQEGCYDTAWTLHSWCPGCSSRREIIVTNVDCYQNCLINTYRDYDRKQGLSAYSLFDVVEELSGIGDRL